MSRYIWALTTPAIYIIGGVISNVLVGGDPAHVSVVYLVVALGLQAIRNESRVIILEGGIAELRTFLLDRLR